MPYSDIYSDIYEGDPIVVERASINETVQIGVETTEGTAVPANKFLPGLSIDLSPNTTSNEQNTAGVKLPTIHQPGFEYSDVKVSSNGPTYDEILYLLNSLLVHAAPVQEGATTAYTSTFAPSGTQPDTVDTFTVEQGSAVRAAKAAGMRITDLGLDWDRDSLKLSGGGLARLMTDAITLTASPTAIPQVVMQPKDISIFVDPTFGALGTTKLLRALKGSLKIGNRFGGVKANDKAQTSFAAMVELAVKGTIDLTLEADAAGMAFLTQYRNATRLFMRVDITSDLLAGTAKPYKSLIDIAVDVSKINPYSDEQGVRCIPVSGTIVYDGGWGKWINWVNTAKTTAL